MAKKETKIVQAPTRKQLAHRKRNEDRERKVLIGAGAVVALIVIVLVIGLVQVYVLRPGAPIATVDGAPISTSLYQKMFLFQNYQLDRALAQMKAQQAQYAGDEKQKFMYDYLQQNVQQMQSRQLSLPQEVLTTLIDDEILRKEAARRNIAVAPEEVQKEIQKQFGYDSNPPTPTATATLTATQVVTVTPTATTPPMTEDQFKQLYGSSLAEFQKASNISDADFRELVRTSIIRDKLQTILATEVPTTAEQIQVSHILIATQQPTDTTGLSPEQLAEAQKAADDTAKAKAEVVLQRVTTAKEDFATVAKEVSDDPGSKDSGGDLGWHPKGDMVPEFDNVAFSLKDPGQIYTDVVRSQFGYHIIKLNELDKNHPLGEYALQTRQSQALDTWLATAHQTAKIERFWSADLVPTPIVRGASAPISQ